MTETSTKDLKELLEYAHQLYIESTGASTNINISFILSDIRRN